MNERLSKNTNFEEEIDSSIARLGVKWFIKFEEMGLVMLASVVRPLLLLEMQNFELTIAAKFRGTFNGDIKTELSVFPIFWFLSNPFLIFWL